MTGPTRRIALILATPGTTWGGMEKHTLELARGLAQAGHEIHILAAPDYSERFQEMAHVHPIPVHFSRRHPWLGLRIRRLLRRIRPDIVHAQGNKAAQLLGNVKRRRDAAQCTYVGTLHGTKSSHRAFAKMDGVIAVSDELAARLDHPNATVIYNGAAPAGPDTRTTWPVPARHPLTVAAGRLEPVKGFHSLINAWARLPDDAGQLVILGEGGQREALARQIEDTGQQARIALPGYEANIAPWLARADACIISSEREGFPYILIEALLQGCPVLSTPVSGVAAFLPESALAAGHDAEALATLLRRALADPDALRDQQQEAFAKAERELTLDGMVQRTLAFYERLKALTPPAGADAERG
ncbi:glycosyltransferase [Marinobacter bohaiensis]|uniref:glycosyltransferase n=1 Tax=Marinobacter bohaiensis TaxID=2201898 RepID=UPI000DAC7CFC|nr:glycosyltransferase [Marinobacter bohaiensis]